MPHIVMAATRDVLGAIRDRITGQRSRPKGASTITQQLARGLFPEAVGFQIGDVSLERKIKEAIVAIQIEKRYTKHEIFTLYANQMYLGEGAYGVEAAARTYFGKSAKDLTLDEAAMIAGLLQTWRNAPTVNMERAKRRRAYVLQRMAEEGFITQKEADEASARPIVLAPPADARQFDRAVLRRGGPQGAREPLRREAALRERPVGPDRARRQAAGRRQPRARRRAAPDRQAARLPQAAPQRPRGRPDDRGLQAPALGSADGGRRRRPRGRHRRRRRGDSAAGRRAARDRSTRRASPGRGKTRRHAARARAAISSKPGCSRSTTPRTPRPARSSSRRSSKARCSRSTTAPARSSAMVGGYSFERSKFNRATQALPAGRLGVQAVRLHGRDRSRLHAVDDPHGHAGELSRRRRSAARTRR